MPFFKKKTPTSQTAGLLIALSILIAVGFLVLFIKTDLDRGLIQADLAYLAGKPGGPAKLAAAKPATPSANATAAKQRLWFAGLSFEYDAEGAELTTTDKSLRIEHPMTDALTIEKIDKAKLPNGLVDTGVANVGALLKDCGEEKCVEAAYYLGQKGTYKLSIQGDFLPQTRTVYPWLDSLKLRERPAFSESLK